jgi:Na+-translocating ferredoxin:NAD+ oxidoreductase RnfD subunit
VIAFFKTPKNLMLPFLLLLFLVASPRLGYALAVTTLLFSVGSTVTFDLLFAFLRRRTVSFPVSGIITGLILALVIDPGSPWYQIVFVGASAMGLKHFLRFGGKHIFNPAASGLLVGFLVFGLQPGWWAPSGSLRIEDIIIYLPILLISYVSCRRYRRYNSVLAFLGVFAVTSLVVVQPFSLMRLVGTVLSPGMLFYALVMLPEPMTSPINKKRQLLYGTFVALVLYGISLLSGRVSFTVFDASLIALLLGNLVFFKLR